MSLKSVRISSRKTSFMSRLSEALSSSPQKFRNDVPTPCKFQDSFTENHWEKERFPELYDQEDEPGYTTIHEMKSIEKDDTATSPPVPPKTTEALYSAMLKNEVSIDHSKCHEKMQYTDRENEMLRHRILELLQRENKWKREVAEAMIIKQANQYALESNTELNRRIAKLEEDTKEEVNLLLEQVDLIKEQKEAILHQFQCLQKEHHFILKKYNNICLEKRDLISLKRHVNKVNENQRVLDETREKYEGEIKKIKDEFILAEEKKNTFKIQFELMTEEKEKLQDEKKELMETLKDATSTKQDMIHELGRMKNNEVDILNLLGSLLKMTEEVIMERDVVMNKSALQEEQRKMVHVTAMDYSVNVGRLQEHITYIRKKVNDHLKRLSVNNQGKDVQFSMMKQSYEKQLASLRGKIVQQNHFFAHVTQDKNSQEENDKERSLARPLAPA